MDGYERRTEAKKQKILVAAQKLFFRQGVTETTMAAIAREAGVSQVSIYNYFGSKENLLQIVIQQHLEDSLAKAEAVINLDLPFKEKLEKFISLGEAEQDKVDDSLMNSLKWDDPKILEIYNDFVVQKQLPFLFRFIEIGKTEGAIESWLDTEAVLAYFGANMTVYTQPDFLKKGSVYIRSLSHLFFYGLLGK